MSQPPQERNETGDLCATVSARTRARGHELGPWKEPHGEEAVARVATCMRCGRVAYVRFESGFIGAAGQALTEVCEKSPRQQARSA
jgi:hypothetical protein